MMAKKTFQTDFAPYACIGDIIEHHVSLGPFYTGLRLVATLYDDDDTTQPDKRQHGFYPSLDPESPGYIGPKSESALRRVTERAQEVMKAWRKDEWCYCGVAVRAWFDEIPLTDEYDYAVWSVEMNYPSRRKGNTNTYLRDLADELAYDCCREAIGKLTELMRAD